jgi:hypothetical protein
MSNCIRYTTRMRLDEDLEGGDHNLFQTTVLIFAVKILIRGDTSAITCNALKRVETS